MTRQTVLVGKIGPAFNGGEIRSHGAATMGIHPTVWEREPVQVRYFRTYVLDTLTDAIADNIEAGAAYIEWSMDYTPRTMGEVIGILS